MKILFSKSKLLYTGCHVVTTIFNSGWHEISNADCQFCVGWIPVQSTPAISCHPRIAYAGKNVTSCVFVPQNQNEIQINQCLFNLFVDWRSLIIYWFLEVRLVFKQLVSILFQIIFGFMWGIESFRKTSERVSYAIGSSSDWLFRVNLFDKNLRFLALTRRWLKIKFKLVVQKHWLIFIRYSIVDTYLRGFFARGLDCTRLSLSLGSAADLLINIRVLFTKSV